MAKELPLLSVVRMQRPEIYIGTVAVMQLGLFVRAYSCICVAFWVGYAVGLLRERERTQNSELGTLLHKD